jgi:hypothetical protein
MKKQNANSDALYEERLHIMENLRKSFEIFCTPNTQTQFSQISSGTQGVHPNIQRNPES